MKLLADALYLIIAMGWLYLLLVGPEMDRALSGGIPGHNADHKEELCCHNSLSDLICWVLFLGILILLPIIAIWSVKTFS